LASRYRPLRGRQTNRDASGGYRGGHWLLYQDRGTIRWGRQRCDLFIEADETKVPVEAKLLRFRYDNGNIDPNSFAKVFSPFPERTTSSLLTDARKLHDADFENAGGLLGLYYAPVEEAYDRMSAEAIAEKFCIDIEYWYDFKIETRNVAHFDGLRHPVHQEGAVITWEIFDSA